MLGYIRPDRAELKIRDYEIYRGVYCSLCNALGRNYTVLGRLLLNYDFTFAALLLLAVSGNPCTFTRKHCPLNPLKKCIFCDKTPVLDRCAHIAVIIAYYNLRDNFKDKGFVKKIVSALVFPSIALMHKKARRLAPGEEAMISESMKQQEIAENKGAGLDEAAHPSANTLGKIFADGFEGEKADAMYETGYYTGRMIYILDAADDLENDIKSGNFNPYKSEFPEINSPEKKKEFIARAEKSVNLTHAALLEAAEKIETRGFGEIIDNIICGGFLNAAGKIYGKYTEEKTDSRSFTVK